MSTKSKTTKSKSAKGTSTKGRKKDPTGVSEKELASVAGGKGGAIGKAGNYANMAMTAYSVAQFAAPAIQGAVGEVKKGIADIKKRI
jgi:hypothetical protein